MLFTFTYMGLPGKPFNVSPSDFRLPIAVFLFKAAGSRRANNQDKINRKHREFPANSPKIVG